MYIYNCIRLADQSHTYKWRQWTTPGVNNQRSHSCRTSTLNTATPGSQQRQNYIICFICPGLGKTWHPWLRSVVGVWSLRLQRAELVNFRTFYPFKLVCMDYLTLKLCKGQIQNILVVTDHLSNVFVAVLSKNHAVFQKQ